MSTVPAPPPPAPPAVPPPAAAVADTENNYTHRLFIGGLGALTPVVAQLLLVDLAGVLAQASGFAILGYCIRVALLFAVGVLAVFLDGSEFNRARLFQIGMGAPSLLLATMNGAQLSQAHVQQAQTPTAYYAPVIPPVTAHLPPLPPVVADQDGVADVDAGPAVSLDELARRALAKAMEERAHADRAAALAEQARRVACASGSGATCPPSVPVRVMAVPVAPAPVPDASTNLGEVIRGAVGGTAK